MVARVPIHVSKVLNCDMFSKRHVVVPENKTAFRREGLNWLITF